jgi:hypothetical protein
MNDILGKVLLRRAKAAAEIPDIIDGIGFAYLTVILTR